MILRAVAPLLLFITGCSAASQPPSQDLATVDQHIDLAVPSTVHDLAGDLRAPPDLAEPIKYDLSFVHTGCHGTVLCVNGCADGDFSCDDNCINRATPTGGALFNALTNCLDAACPSKVPADVCFNSDAACQLCFSNAENMGGACAQATSDCANDLP